MPPRTYTNPPPLTQSARDALKSFYCETCKKQYSRHDEFDRHLSSYAHTHAANSKNSADIKASMDRATRKRKIEREDLELIKIDEPEPKKPIKNGPSKPGRFLATFGLARGEVPKEANMPDDAAFAKKKKDELGPNNLPPDDGLKVEIGLSSEVNRFDVTDSRTPAGKRRAVYNPFKPALCDENCSCPHITSNFAGLQLGSPELNSEAHETEKNVDTNVKKSSTESTVNGEKPTEKSSSDLRSTGPSLEYYSRPETSGRHILIQTPKFIIAPEFFEE